MQVFNAEPVGPRAKVILLLDQKEARTLTEAMEAAVKSNKRKITWRRLYNKLGFMACY